MAPEKEKALAAAMSQIDRKFGKGSIMKMGEVNSRLAIEAIPTGAIALDIALGIGGLPRGRVVEIFGPESSGKTTLAQHIIAEAQKLGGVCAFIDAEHAFDPIYAQRCGVQIDDLLVSQPDTGEQGLEICETLVRSNAIDVIVIDSVAALVPRAEIEGDMGDSLPGLQARLMSQALRKLSGAINKSRTVVIFLNQLRMKIGVMFGCFHYDARVILADGTSEKIGKIVNQKMPVEVMSYNHTTGQFEPRPVVNWFNNGPTDLFLQFTVAANEGSGRHAFACTPNHLLLSEYGYKPAEELQVGDRLMTMVQYYLSSVQKQVVIGSLLGDGSLRKSSDFNTSLRIGHGAKQDAYCLWKQSLFQELIGSETTNSRGGHSFDTIPMYELTQVLQDNYDQRGKNPSQTLIDRLTPLAIAIWYMDDGTFDSERQNRCSISCPGLPLEKQQALVRWFHDQGIAANLDGRGRINFGVLATSKLHELIAPFIHPSMEYKLLPELRGRFVPFETRAERTLQAVPLPIVDIHVKPETRGMNRFDLEVEGNHSYLVDGVVVHNSPETTTGGQALKFYASVRLDIRRIETLKSGQEVIGSRARVKVIKNKVAPPFRQAEFDILANEGISREGNILDVGVEMNIIRKSGAWFYLAEDRLGQGRENVRNFLKENPALTEEIERLIKSQGLSNPIALPVATIADDEDAGLFEDEE
ncbi:MAG: recombinase RecA [Chloroflexia bacterium]|nr:recombinase RecA [Chloroflexia bacterium]